MCWNKFMIVATHEKYILLHKFDCPKSGNIVFGYLQHFNGHQFNKHACDMWPYIYWMV
jgi:hypothetical protein